MDVLTMRRPEVKVVQCWCGMNQPKLETTTPLPIYPHYLPQVRDFFDKSSRLLISSHWWTNDLIDLFSLFSMSHFVSGKIKKSCAMCNYVAAVCMDSTNLKKRNQYDQKNEVTICHFHYVHATEKLSTSCQWQIVRQKCNQVVLLCYVKHWFLCWQYP